MRHGGTTAMGFYSMREKCNSEHKEKWELIPKEQGMWMCVCGVRASVGGKSLGRNTQGKRRDSG